NGNEIYLTGSGTSFSAPFAAGAAALVHQVTPSLTPAAIRDVLERTGDTITDYRNGVSYKRLNVFNALNAVVPAPPAPPAPPPPATQPPAAPVKHKKKKHKAPKPTKSAAKPHTKAAAKGANIRSDL